MAGYRSFLFSEAVISDCSITLDPRESHHLIKVLRARAGAEVELLDGQGKIYRGQIKEPNAKGVQVAVDEVVSAARSKPKVTLIQSITKGKTMDLVLRMGTEIGAACIQPVFTNHGEVQIKGERLRSKVDKWEMTMIEACKQCGLPFLPSLGTPCRIDSWLDAHSVGDGDLRIVASLEEGSRPLGRLLADYPEVASVVVAVGPEGDFSPSEYQALANSGFRPVRLGENILRAETAAAYLLSVVDQHYLCGISEGY